MNIIQLINLWERRKLPQGVWGGGPEANAVFNIFCQNGVHFLDMLISYFLAIKSKKIVDE